MVEKTVLLPATIAPEMRPHPWGVRDVGTVRVPDGDRPFRLHVNGINTVVDSVRVDDVEHLLTSLPAEAFNTDNAESIELGLSGASVIKVSLRGGYGHAVVTLGVKRLSTRAFWERLRVTLRLFWFDLFEGRRL